jgi:hypothetical protein
MKMNGNHQISHSKDKHESVIPVFDTQHCCDTFFQTRKTLFTTLNSGKFSLSTPQCKAQLAEQAFSISDTLFYKVEKRFIVHGDFQLQDKALILPLSRSQKSELPFLLLNFLLEQFIKKNDYNALNSAVRIIDYFQSQTEKLNHQQQCFLYFLAEQEQQILTELYNENC